MSITLTRRAFLEATIKRTIDPKIMLAIKSGSFENGPILNTDRPGFAKHDIMQGRSQRMVSGVYSGEYD